MYVNHHASSYSNFLQEILLLTEIKDIHEATHCKCAAASALNPCFHLTGNIHCSTDAKCPESATMIYNTQDGFVVEPEYGFTVPQHQWLYFNV